jgi:4-hydroxy-tetrahydrodipicolinate synthase
MKLHGIIPPVITPMTPDQEIDLPGLRRHIDWMLAQRVHGIFVLGTTGEFYGLDESEKQAVVAAAVAHCAGRSPVYAGTEPRPLARSSASPAWPRRKVPMACQ